MNLTPQTHRQDAVAKRMANRILAVNPGMGEKSMRMAEDIADSGLPSTAAVMLIQAVYSPTDDIGRGQATRAKWFISAVRNRYHHKLDKIRNNTGHFRVFLADMEEVVNMRDTLRGEGCSVSFEAAFLLWEQGMSADSILNIISDCCGKGMPPGASTKMVIRAAQMVKAGHFLNIETAIDSMRYGYQYER